ncbi:hypothetical protein ACEUDZ_16230 [Aeromonas veronii]
MAVNGIRRNIIPRDDVFIDYLWYRTCQINGYSDYTTPSNNDLEEKLRQAVITPTAEQFMLESDRRNNNPFGLERWIDTLKNKFDYNCLKKDDFDWLEDHPRTRCYIWRLMSYLSWTNEKIFMGLDNIFHHHISPIIPSADISSKHMVRMEHIDNYTVTKREIIYFINRLNNTKYEKMELVKYIKDAAAKYLRHNEVAKWFANDKTQKQKWLCEYLISVKLDYVQLTMPNSSSLVNDLISFFDVLHTFNEDKYKWIFINIRKAWNQRTYRERNKTKKQYSINMSDDIGKILDELSLDKRENKNAIVEALIRAEYKKLPR